MNRHSMLAEEIAGDIILDALMRRYPDKQDFATNEIEVRAVAKVIDQKLSGVREAIEPIRASCTKTTIDGVSCFILDWDRLTEESISNAADLWESLKLIRETKLAYELTRIPKEKRKDFRSYYDMEVRSKDKVKEELSKAQEKIKELEALAKAVYDENSKGSYGSEEQSSNIHNLLAKHFWPNDPTQWS